ncbi:helix-turn-helix domain-containing protein [Haladaptatus cibarius]|uniref:helix-turn-helix domain-containing protein n=1 Tax=Haladaptatus cibarius TaxID=453847 RepID=UPI0006796E67|nr:helix-turn-helix domain-containing protein [Haladaptatus cibarius]
MRFLRLTLGPELIAPSPAATSGEVLNVQYVSDGTVLELYSVEGDLDRILHQMETSPNTCRFEYLGTQAGRHYIFHSGRPSEEVQALIELLEEFHLMVVLPLLFDDTTGATVDIIGEAESLHQVYKQFPPEIRHRTTIEQVGKYVPNYSGILSVLTERQREVLHAAVAVGYYATPRSGTAEDVGEVVGCAPSTAAEHLRKLEARLFIHLVGSE